MRLENTLQNKLVPQRDRFSHELQRIIDLVAANARAPQAVKDRPITKVVEFLADGRILCRERSRGDSRYPYGRHGFNFWVSANGAIHANRGLYFLFLPTVNEGTSPSIAFFSGVRSDHAATYHSHSLLPVPFLLGEEKVVTSRYTVIGHDATYFLAETPELSTAVRIFSSQTRGNEVDLYFTLQIENRTPTFLETYTSAFLNPFCRHQFAPSSEDRWFKQVSVLEPLDDGRLARLGQNSQVLPAFLIRTNEDVGRLHSYKNLSLVRRAVTQGQTHSHLIGTDGIDNGYWLEKSGKRMRIDTPYELREQHSTSWLGYVGSPRRDLGSASFLETGALERDIDITTFNDNAVVSDMLHFRLPPLGGMRVDYVFSTLAGDEELAQTQEHVFGASQVDLALELEKQVIGVPGDLQITAVGSTADIDADTLNTFLVYLQRQVEVCATLQGYMQPTPNSLIGFRDVFQALEAHLFVRPAESRQKILEGLGHMLVDGRCPRQYSLSNNGQPAPADLREFVDQGTWAISTLYTYLAVTGDPTILDETVDFCEPYPTGRALVPAAKRSSVLEHLLDAINYLIRQRDPETGLVRALYGDWNDAIDGLGVSRDGGSDFGNGVSIMVSLQLYQNCSEMLEILARYCPGSFLEERAHLQQVLAALRAALLQHAVETRAGERRIVHGWGEHRSFTVGGFQDADGLCRDGLTSNAFWVLAGMLDSEPSLRSDILQAFRRLDSKYGLRTFAPGFGPSAGAIGRINRLPIGTAENGAVYVHATTFGIAALFRLGESEFAWEQLRKILPFGAHLVDPSHSPFVMPNSYAENLELNLDGQSMNDWQTGSSNVLLKLLIRYVCGLDVRLNHLQIAPASWSPFARLHCVGRVHGRQIDITVQRGEVSEREIRHNGKLVDDLHCDPTSQVRYAKIPLDMIGQSETHSFVVTDPE